MMQENRREQLFTNLKAEAGQLNAMFNSMEYRIMATDARPVEYDVMMRIHELTTLLNRFLAQSSASGIFRTTCNLMHYLNENSSIKLQWVLSDGRGQMNDFFNRLDTCIEEIVQELEWERRIDE